MNVFQIIHGTWQLLPRPIHRWIQFLLLLSFVGAAFEAIGLGMIVPLIALLTDAEAVSDQSGLAKIAHFMRQNLGNDAVPAAAVGVLGIFAIKNLYLISIQALRIVFILRGERDLSAELLQAKLRESWLIQRQTGLPMVMRHVLDNPAAVYRRVILFAMALCTEFALLFLMMVTLFVVDPKTTAWGLVVAGGSALLYYRGVQPMLVKRGAMRYRAQKARREALFNAWSSPRETRLYRANDFFVERYLRANSDLLVARGYLGTARMVPPHVLEFLGVMTLVTVLLVAEGQGVVLNEFVPVLALVAVVAMKAIPAVNRLLRSFVGLRQMGEDIGEVLDAVKAPRRQKPNPAPGAAAEFPALKVELKLDGVTFCYPDATTPVIENFTATLQACTMVGLVGPSGSGKTTLGDLILGFLAPTQGEILVDGQSIQSNIMGWQEHLAYVPQEVAVIPGTIWENVAFGHAAPQEAKARILDAIKSAQLGPWLQDQVDGLDTLVGPGGVMLSGGEKQRLGIARALFRQPTLLVLDEPTSALDEQTEAAFLEILNKLKNECTVLVITHRATTRQACDDLILLNPNGSSQKEGVAELASVPPPAAATPIPKI
jgi:ABC-type multidrug transport system fused ATPase/permease subunit